MKQVLPSAVSFTRLPHHRLDAYRVACELLVEVRRAGIRDPKLRDQALRAAKGVACVTGEGVGRMSPADKANRYSIARGEVLEVAIAVEIAWLAGDASEESSKRCNILADRISAMLYRLAGR
jgi:four helix bundle protein